MSGGPPPSGGRSRGKGRGGGRGRGGGGGGRKADNSSKPPPKKKGGRGGRSNKTPSETPEEKAKKAEIARQKQEAAAEKKRQEQEAREAAEAAAALKLKQEAADEEIRQAHEVLQTAIEAAQFHVKLKDEMESLVEKRKEFEANKKKLKTDLKKCTAFVKKIKSGSVWSMKAADVEKDISTLNLSRYVEEVVNGLMESTIKPKLGDIPLFLSLIRAMHFRYSNFLGLLVPQLWSVVNGKTTSDTVKLRRLYLRVLLRLNLSGIVTETKPFTKCLAEAAGAPEYSPVKDAMLVVSFAKIGGYELFGILPQSIKQASEVIRKASEQEKLESDSVAPNSDLVAKAFPLIKIIHDAYAAVQAPEVFGQVCLTHCQGAFNYLQQQLSITHSKLLKLEQRCDQDRLLSGSLTEARENGLVDARKLKESLQKSAEALADILDEKMPTLEEKENLDEMEQGGLEVWTKTEGDENDLGPFDDEETKAFYSDVPDLLTTIPPALLGLSQEAIEERKTQNQAKYGQDENIEEGEEDIVVEQDFEPGENEGEEMALSDDEEDEGGDEEELEKDEDETDTPHYRLMVLLEQELPECNRREQVDELTDKFCTNHGSAKNSRKRLSKALFEVPRARLDLLPYYARMTATLDRVWTDIAEPLVVALEQQFHGQSKFKKNQSIEARLKTAKYIGELTKFRVAPPMVFLRCLRRCLDDFTGNNVDVACCLLESAGRFLHRMQHTCARIEALLETITRLSKAKNLDERHQALIKAAFHAVKPPPSGPKKQTKQYPPLEAYLRHLLIVELEPTDASISSVVKQLVRLPWSDPSYDCGNLVSRIMMKACRKGRYRTIYAIAAVTERLRTQRSAAEASVRLLDSVLEELRWALEHPDFRDQQRTLTYARLLGELYCLHHVNGQLILDQLYDFINIGHEIPDALRDASKQLIETGSDGPTSLLTANHNVTQTIQEDEELDDQDNQDEAKEEAAPPQPVAASAVSRYDPRVPSAADPPNSAYRVKLVCTTLEVVAKKILTRMNLPRVKGFLAAFQRYLFTKIALPADVEFTLLDTFDVIDSQWKRFLKRGSEADKADEGFERFRSWLEAHNATVAFEEAEARLEKERQLNTDDAGDDSKSIEELNLEDQMSDEGSLDDDDDVSVGHSQEESLEDDGHSTDGDTATKDVDEAYEEEFDEEAYMQQLEEEEFEREIRRVTKEALDKGKSVSRKLVHESMISGSQVVKKKPADITSSEGPGSSPFPVFGDGEGVTFQVLRKGNKGKVEAKDLFVPSDTNLAKGASRQDGEAAKERDAIKERVLRYEMDSAEAELTGGNVYLEQSKLQVIRNKQLSMDTIDKNFGTRGGNLQESRPQRRPPSTSSTTGRAPFRGGPGRGRGRGRSASGRTLFRG